MKVARAMRAIVETEWVLIVFLALLRNNLKRVGHRLLFADIWQLEIQIIEPYYRYHQLKGILGHEINSEVVYIIWNAHLSRQEKICNRNNVKPATRQFWATMKLVTLEHFFWIFRVSKIIWVSKPVIRQACKSKVNVVIVSDADAEWIETCYFLLHRVYSYFRIEGIRIVSTLQITMMLQDGQIILIFRNGRVVRLHQLWLSRNVSRIL